jgi:hypothetical protein
LRVHRAANLINLERGVNDAGLTGGTGKWSFHSLLAFIDHRQAEGHGVVFDATSTTAAGRLYGLAAYFLISSDRDGLGNNQGGTPTDWWTGYDVDLGAPLARRYLWKGAYRRDFARGFTLVNPPGAPAVTLPLGAGARNLTGVTQSSVTLAAAAGAVFTTAATPVPAATATFTVPEAPAATTSVRTSVESSSTAVQQPATAAGIAARASRSTLTPTFTLKVAVLPAARAAGRDGRAASRHVRFSGRVPGARGGRVQIVVRRKAGRRVIRRVRQRTSHGRFIRVLPRLRPGRYHVAVTFRARTTSPVSHAAVRPFSVPR